MQSEDLPIPAILAPCARFGIVDRASVRKSSRSQSTQQMRFVHESHHLGGKHIRAGLILLGMVHAVYIEYTAVGKNILHIPRRVPQIHTARIGIVPLRRSHPLHISGVFPVGRSGKAAVFRRRRRQADAENVTGIYQTAYNIGVNENTFVRENYTFIGWNTEADGTGKAYAANDVIALTAENNTEILYAQWEINTYDYIVNYWVRVNEEAYVIFAGELGGAPVGEKVAVGSVIDQAYLTEKGLPETLTDAEHTYELAVFQGVVVADAENIVNVYYTCVVEEEVETPEPPVVPPVDPEEPEEPEDVEIPDEDVPLGGQPGDTLPKTGDPIYIYIGSAAVSAAGLVGLFLAKNRKEEEEEE